MEPIRCRRAFTLIELLVVISIIALLMSIMMPSLQKARDAAKTVTCKADIRNIHLASTAYVYDNNDKLPGATERGKWINVEHPEWQKGHWQYKLWTYLGYSISEYEDGENDFRRCEDPTINGSRGEDKNIFNCSVTRTKLMSTYVGEDGNGVECEPNPLLYSYGMNIHPSKIELFETNKNSSFSTDGIYYHSLAVRRIAAPSSCALFLECSLPFAEPYQYTYWPGLITSLYPHSKRTNVVFHDGHMQTMKKESFTSPIHSENVESPFWCGKAGVSGYGH